MSISIYDFSVPPLKRGLINLSALLAKGVAHAENKKFDSTVLVQARLFPDMLALASQVQIACDNAKGAVGRLAQVEVPKHADDETTFAQLQARIAKTIEFLDSVHSDKLQGAESRSIEVKFPNAVLTFTGLSYLTGFVLPNFYFHVSMVYALLRNNGIEVGKRDFLGAMQT